MTPAATIRASMLVLVLGAATAGGPAWAEGNRLLPFWGQPYPYGYAYEGLDRQGPEPCPEFRRSARRHVPIPRRCTVILHARD